MSKNELRNIKIRANKIDLKTTVGVVLCIKLKFVLQSNYHFAIYSLLQKILKGSFLLMIR